LVCPDTFLAFACQLQATNLSACQSSAAPIPGDPSSTGTCQLSSAFNLSQTFSSSLPFQTGLSCPAVMLTATSMGSTAPSGFTQLWALFQQNNVIGRSDVVSCSPTFFNAAGCTCDIQQQRVVRMKAQNGSSGLDSWKCESLPAQQPLQSFHDPFSDGEKAMTGALSGSVLLLGLAYGLYRSGSPASQLQTSCLLACAAPCDMQKLLGLGFRC
jgi:hypothetical protein